MTTLELTGRPASGPGLQTALPRDISAKLFARILVVARTPEQYYNLRWGMVNKGYRNFDVVESLEELATAWDDATPDMILVSSSPGDSLLASVQNLVAAKSAKPIMIHSVMMPDAEWSQPLGAFVPIEVDTIQGRIQPSDIPLNFELELISRCNARCNFCPIQDMDRLGNTMSDEVLDRILERIAQLDTSLVYLCGVGEPLLYKKLVDVVRRVSTEVGCPVGVNTNGQLLTGARFEELLDAGLSMVNVSINGTSNGVYEEHMKYLDRDKVTRNLKEVLKIKPEAVSLQGVITARNQHELPGLVDYWANLGVRVFTFNECSNKSGFLQDYAALHYADIDDLSARMAAEQNDAWVSFNSCNFGVKQTGAFQCRVPVNFLSIDVHGQLTHCMHDFAGETSYGTFTDIPVDQLPDLMMDRVGAKPRICDTCNACDLKPAKVIWRGDVVVERNVFAPGTALWETALHEQSFGPPQQ
ncbi:radical SAM protein [Gymnodinialimonas sp.]